MRDPSRFETLFGDHGASAMEPVGPVCPPQKRPGSTFIDAIVGLCLRLAMAIGLFLWVRQNAVPLYQWTDLGQWIAPQEGFVQALSYWFGLFDPALLASGVLLVAQGLVLSLALGVFVRLSGLIILVSALVYAALILPEAWSSAIIYGALGLYLTLRGGGPIGLDWILLRLSRLSSEH